MCTTYGNQKTGRKRIIMKLCFVVILLIFCSPSSSNASHDPWGENLQPKLHTDYLNEYSGKTKSIYYFWSIFDKNGCYCQNKMVFDSNWIQFLFHAHNDLKQQQNISPNYSNKTIWHQNNFCWQKIYYHKRDETWLSIIFYVYSFPCMSGTF